ncbi:MAG TPA: hypothetical protein VGE26_02905 [Sphingobacteriaceae bacterium]
MKIKYLIAAIFTSCSLSVHGQVFESEQNPPGIKFREIVTENFQLIYPEEIESDAQRMANTLGHLLPHVANTLRKKPRKISIILQNQGTESNGFVQLAPRRSEFFTTPPQSSDYQDWLNSLAVHELRHVVQFDKLTGYLRKPFFEELALLIFGVTLPPWFYEGDAVGIETALTGAGRGRLPGWELIFRTNTLSGKKYSYTKNYLGSVKDLTPGYYQLGYFMTSRLRREHGSNILDSLYHRIRKNPLRPYNFSNSLRHFTGMTTRRLHDSTVKELAELWTRQAAKIDAEKFPALNKKKRRYPLDYLLPVAVSDSQILALKQGRQITPELILIDRKGNEKRMLKIGYQKEPHFHFAADKIVWDEIRFDGRFHKRSFNVINISDLVTGSRKQLTHKTRLFAPALSPDGSLITAVEVSVSNRIALVEIDPQTGNVLKRYPSPRNASLQTPSFDETGSKIVMAAVTAEGIGLLELDRTTGVYTTVLPFQRQQIARPVYAGQRIVFKAHYNGIDNLYILQNEQTFRLTSVEFGAFNPSFDRFSRQILFNNYQPAGFDVSTAKLTMQAPADFKSTFINYASPVAAQEGLVNVFDSIPDRKFASRPYSELKNLFYFHSLGLSADDNPYFNDYNIGIHLKSDNKLNTLGLSVGYEYNKALRGSEYLASLSYKKYLPIIRLAYHNQPRLLYQRNQTAAGVALIPITWREHITEANISLPLAFNRFDHTYNVSAGVGTSYTSRYEIMNRPRTFIGTLEFPVRYTLNLSGNSIRNAMDLAPRFGQNINLSYRHFPLDDNFAGYLFTLRSRFYFPGLGRNHSFQAAFNYQSSGGTYNSTTDIPYIRGYGNLRPTENLENTLFLDYRLPLFYPDWEVSTLAYIKRVRGGIFADYENIGKQGSYKPRSFGVNLQADMNLLRFYLPNFAAGGAIIFTTGKSAQNPIFDFSFSYTF